MAKRFIQVPTSNLPLSNISVWLSFNASSSLKQLAPRFPIFLIFHFSKFYCALKQEKILFCTEVASCSLKILAPFKNCNRSVKTHKRYMRKILMKLNKRHKLTSRIELLPTKPVRRHGNAVNFFEGLFRRFFSCSSSICIVDLLISGLNFRDQ